MSLKLHTMEFNAYESEYESDAPRKRFVLLAETLGIPTIISIGFGAGTMLERVELWCHDVQWQMLLDVFRPYASKWQLKRYGYDDVRYEEDAS